MNKFKRFLSLALVLCMVMAFIPVSASAAEDASYAYNIVHVDAGRKYFSVENLMTIIDNAADAGFNQVQLYLSDNQGFRFALDDMTISTEYGDYDLTPALGDGYSDGSKYPDYSGKYLTQAEMDEIIAYANGKGIDIVPCVNVPGHMGAILEEFPGFRYKKSSYSVSKSSIDLNNAEAVAFALALTEKYASYFASAGCKFYNVGADEYANDLTTMGFEGMGTAMYTKFVQFLNDAADIILDLGMTPRAFNDGFYYKDYKISLEPNKAYEVCYWSSGWSGYDVAAASTIAAKGHKMINTNGDYYWVLGNSGWQCSPSKARQFVTTTFPGGSVSEPAGSMFCIWCDNASVNGADGGAAVAANTAAVIAAFGAALPAVDTLVEDSSKDEPEVTEPVSTEPVTETDADTGIAVSAPGLTGLTAEEADVPTIRNAHHVRAWDLTPATESGAYTGEATVSVPVPEGWNTDAMGAFVVNADGTVTMLSGTYENGSYTYTCPHFSVTGIYDVAAAADKLEPEVEVTEERKINVEVGKSVTDVITGGEYAADKNELNESVATVSTTTDPGVEATVTYDRTSVTNGNLIGSNGTYVNTGYYVENDGSYYPLYASRSSAGSSRYNYTWYCLKDGRYEQVGSESNARTYGNPSIAVYSKSGSEGVPASTTVTFTGVKQGTTTVIVGHVKYTVNVVPNLNGAAGLTVEFWVTNRPVTANGDTQMVVAAKDAYGVDGVALIDVVPYVGEHETNMMHFWKGTRHASGSHQNDGIDRTATGTDYAYIRYYNGAWAYSANRTNWTAVRSGDQMVAYYLQFTEVTDEVETLVVDWGVVPSTSYNSENFVLVDYAVKYESGERVPSSFPVNGKTQAFHCDPADTNTVHQYNGGSKNTWYNNYRDIKMIKANETAEYEVYMITLTPTSDSRTTQVAGNANQAASYAYDGTEKVIWVDDEANLGAFADENLHYTSISGKITYSVGGEPIVPGLEIFNRHGMLVTYYVRAKATEDSLTVHYIDATVGANNLEFYSYNIAVKEGTYFKTGIALPNPWKGNLVNGNVENYYGRTQYVSSDLSTLSQIGAQYLYTDYECIRVERSEDGKDVYLYYTFNPTAYFVADFGLPMTITAADLSEALKDAKIDDMMFSGASFTAYGQLIDNGNTITYKPTKVLNGMDYFTLMVQTPNADDVVEDAEEGQVAFRVYVVPATTVHYEESFAALDDGWKINGTGPDTDNDNDTAGKQELQKAGASGLNYGYTGGYTAAGMSNGTEAVSENPGSKAEIRFNGTGIEIYANATEASGVMTLLVYGMNAEGQEVIQKIYQVDTSAANGKSTATDGQAKDSYSLPVISIKDLQPGEHKVVLQHTGAAGSGSVQLDGFRVTNPLGNLASTAYVASEKNPTFLELRNAVLTGQNVTPGSVDSIYEVAGEFLSQVYENEGSSATLALLMGEDLDVQDLLDNGPKNELFLWPGESLTFNLGNARAQIGLKAPMGETSYEIAGIASGTIKTAVDMFYGDRNVTGTIVIKNTGANVLSVTKLKLFGSTTLEPLTVETVAYALNVMGYTDGSEQMARPGAPINNPFVDVAEDSWYYDSVLWAVENGITTGADATHFLPDALCQRASVVTFLWRAAGSPEPETTVNPFVDVTEDTFFYKAVLWALENGITTGVDATHFAPFGTCNRAQVVTFLWRANGSPAASAVNPFTDVAEGQWYTDAIVWAVDNGITNGMGGTIFGVDGICNRAQIVTFLYRASENVR